MKRSKYGIPKTIMSLFSPMFIRSISAPIIGKEIEVLPGIYSKSTEYQQMMIELYAELRDLGLDVEFMFSLPGFGTQALQIAPLMNAPYRESLGLTYKIDTKRKRHIEKFAKFFWSYDMNFDDNEVISWNPDATSGAPLGKLSFTESIRDFGSCLSQLDLFKGLILDENLSGLMNTFKALFCSYTVIRLQPEDTMKKRYFIPNDFILNNGSIKVEEAIKDLDFKTLNPRAILNDSSVVDSFRANRMRAAYAQNGLFQKILGTFFQPFRRMLHSKFAFTFKHIDSEHINSKLSNWKYVVKTDVGNHDMAFPPIMDIVRKCWKDLKYPDYIIKIIQGSFNISLLARPWNTETDKPEMYGNPLDPRFIFRKYDGPLSSGNHITDLAGKFNIMEDLIYNIWTKVFDLNADDLNDDTYERIMSGRHDRFGILDISDDALSCFHRLDDRDNFVKILNEQKDRTFLNHIEAEPLISLAGRIEIPETVKKYLDDNMIDHVDGRLYLNMVSFIKNTLNPEYGISKTFGVAMMAKDQVYRENPLFNKVFEIVDKVFKKNFYKGIMDMVSESSGFGADLNSFVNKSLKTSLLNAESISTLVSDKSKYKYFKDMDDAKNSVMDQLKRGELSIANARALLEPGRMSWDNNVSKEFISTFSSSIPLSELLIINKKIFSN